MSASSQPPRPRPLTDLEVACNRVFGVREDPVLLPEHPPPLAEAVDAVLLDALQHSPCLVSFSGGRDSSVLLCRAVHLARREGLPLPVPATLLFPGDPYAEETEWQELVIGHLGLSDWERLVMQPGELSILGPIAADFQRRHGPVWPANMHMQIPLARMARGGLVITGFDGDGLFGQWPYEGVWRGLRRPSRELLRHKRHLLGMAAPAGVRRRLLRPLAEAQLAWLPWLTAGALAEAARVFVTELAAEPAGWRRHVKWWLNRAVMGRVAWGYARIEDDTGARFCHPFVNPAVVAATAALGTGVAARGRGHLLGLVADGTAPPGVLGRATKAHFSLPMMEGIDPVLAEQADNSCVDSVALLGAWSEPLLRWGTSALVVNGWLRSAKVV